MAVDSTVPPEIANEYQGVTARLDTFRRKEQELILQFGDENMLLKTIRSKIAENEKYQNKLQVDYPALTTRFKSSTESAAGVLVVDSFVEQTRIMALRAKIETLKSQLTNVTAEAATINEIEPTMVELERRKQLEETQFKYYYSSLQQERFDSGIGEGKQTNINVTETATPAVRDTDKSMKFAIMILLGCSVFGLVIAFVIEFYLDQTIKRPHEVETRLKLPLFLSIPHTAELPGNGNGHLQLKPGDGDEGTKVELNGSAAIAPWDEEHKLRVFCEALRDRLVTYFEVRNLTHKPKLVAVTGCSRGAGVTTLASGLAAALSETGDGNVLLVDMNVQNGAAHPFFKGKPGCALADVLEEQNRNGAMVNENLYVASGGRNTNGDKLPRILPKRFSQLMPKLKASDYDYIIFDMPPVSQTSVTARLSTYMDMTLLVLESEKTDREVVKRATALLGESKANVTAILNKTHNYVPRKLHQEFLSNA